MLWSKKTQLAREMKEAVEDSNQVEICALKAEIHRMQVGKCSLQQLCVSFNYLIESVLPRKM